MPERSITYNARKWGERVQAVINTQLDLDSRLSNAETVEEYYAVLDEQEAVDSRRRNVARQLIDRNSTRFPNMGLEVEIIEAIYGDKQKFEALWEELQEYAVPTVQAIETYYQKFGESNYLGLSSEAQSTGSTFAQQLMEERILPYYYGILQPDSSFPDPK